MYDDLSRQELIAKVAELDSKMAAANEAAARLGADLEALIGGMKTVSESKGFTDAARVVFERCKRIIGCASGYVALLSEAGDENEVLFLDSGGLSCDVDPSLPMPIRGLRADAYRLNKTVYDNDFMNSPWAKYMPKGHVVLKNVMFAPLVIDGKTLGIIGLANKAGDFDQNDAKIASGFGELAAIALRNSRNVEVIVKKATEVLETDRNYLSKELHDGISTSLAAIKLKLQMIAAPVPINTAIEIRETIDYLESVIKDTRLIAGKLGSDFDRFDLIPLLLRFCGMMEDCNKGLEIERKIEVLDGEIPRVYKTAIYRVLQEAVSNSVKHGNASKISISLGDRDGKIFLRCEDNGVGFESKRNGNTLPGLNGNGLKNMKERVEIVGGVFEIFSKIGSGTRVAVTFPDDRKC